MKIQASRRAILAALPLPFAGRDAKAAGDWPQRPIRMVCSYAPGGSTDAAARLVSEPMTRLLGQPVIVDNKPGATGTIGAGEVARAPKDGYTILVDGAGHGSNHALYPKLPFDYRRDLIPVTQLTVSPLILAVHPSVPANSLQELIDLARRQPGTLSYGTPGNGSAGHMAAASFAWQAGLNFVQVPYRGGGPAVQDLLANQISFTFASVSAVLSLVSDGKVRPLAGSSPQRIKPLPQIPAMAETFPGFDISEWTGLYVPAGTPEAVVAKLGQAGRDAVKDPVVSERLEKIGTIVVGSPQAEFTAWLSDQRRKMSQLVEAASIRAD